MSLIHCFVGGRLPSLSSFTSPFYFSIYLFYIAVPLLCCWKQMVGPSWLDNCFPLIFTAYTVSPSLRLSLSQSKTHWFTFNNRSCNTYFHWPPPNTLSQKGIAEPLSSLQDSHFSKSTTDYIRRHATDMTRWMMRKHLGFVQKVTNIIWRCCILIPHIQRAKVTVHLEKTIIFAVLSDAVWTNLLC